ncbi:MAG: hypothetical protein HFJ35_02965 [Clostridia bacterium]|nr:hypothetical protein [Clostridia bacterium]
MKKKKLIICIVIILFTIGIPLIGLVILTKNMDNPKIKFKPNIEEALLNEDLISNELVTAAYNENEITQNDIEVINDSSKESQSENKNSKPISQTQAKVSTPKAETTAQTQKQSQEPTQTQTSSQASSTVSTTNTKCLETNNSYINKIRNYINANPSENMKKFGYSIVTDSSISNQLTGFTYSEVRIKDAIKNSFGTIKIYAQDYYVNNELVETRCYVL